MCRNLCIYKSFLQQEEMTYIKPTQIYFNDYKRH
jgi:hypothetical protein